jgi:hypothetical protein
MGILLTIVLVAGACSSEPRSTTSNAGAAESQTAQESETEGGAETEALEQGEAGRARTAALKEAEAEGSFGIRGPIGSLAAAGWSGESLLSPTGNDWEPAIAADPNAPYVYVLTTRYGGAKACSACPSPSLILRVSSNGGQTFGAEQFICTCKNVHAQNDPQIAVASDGTVYAAWLNDYNPGVVVSKSTDHGHSWSTPLALKAKAFNFTDKPWLAISPSGHDVYVAWNKSDNYVSVSHDSGKTFSAPIKTNSDSRYYFAGGGVVRPGGSIVFGETSFTQSSTGPVRVLAIRSTDNGLTWQQVVVDTVQEQPACTSAGCPVDYYGPQAALASDPNGNLVILYAGATSAGGPQRMWARRSTDGGVTWSARVDITGAPAGTNAVFPAVVSPKNGDVRAWFMDDRNGAPSWNTWYTTSNDGGATWTAPVRISDATTGPGLPGYVNSGGFNQPYGDYGEIAVTNQGKTIATWGEGFSYEGPGGTWINRTP